MNKRNIVKMCGIALLFLSFAACRQPAADEGKKDESFGAAPVKVFKVQRQKISEKLFYTGVIEAWNKINLTPDIGGKIARIHVEEGDRVEKGQLLAELDTRAVRLQLDQAQAALAVAEANYNDAQKNMERMERLKKEDAASDQQYEKVKLAYEAADAQLKQARAAVNLARYSLDVSLMKAPFSGVVASKNAEVGDVINPMMGGFSPTSGVLTLMDFSRVKIEIDATQQDVARIKKGQSAQLKVTALPNRIFQGRVSMVNITADPVSKKFRVEVNVDNPDLALRPNTFGEVSLEVSTHEHALVIPQKAVLENKYVFRVKDDNTVERVELSLGLQNSDRIEVINGLKEGDLVVVEGNFGLEDGTQIEIREVIE
ncbi:MAG: efflux RND transporter periplasmic adaptor subunit [Candidatus Aminicenantes bacterium]|nr:efflux RND transporter periplasmic adaptor subunit [Candidatus Aminicenantes bacterium]